MTTAALKKKIKALVDKETNEKKLVKVHSTLVQETKAEAVKRRMLEVAKESERDIKAGRTMGIDELHEDMERYITEIYSGKQGKVAAARRPKAQRSRSTKTDPQ
jgi:protein-tyrosine-phosphatase